MSKQLAYILMYITGLLSIFFFWNIALLKNFLWLQVIATVVDINLLSWYTYQIYKIK